MDPYPALDGGRQNAESGEADESRCLGLVGVHSPADYSAGLDVVHAVIATIPTGHGPFISQISPDQTKLYVSDTRSTTVTVIDIASLTVLSIIPNVGMQPFDMTFGP